MKRRKRKWFKIYQFIFKIHDKIKEDIEKGVWSIGDRLPSERELALKFDVSRMTLRQAIQTLADEGILERKIGSGTYVARKKVQETMTGTTSFTELPCLKIAFLLVGRCLIL